jgi:hypothetical protein
MTIPGSRIGTWGTQKFATQRAKARYPRCFGPPLRLPPKRAPPFAPPPLRLPKLGFEKPLFLGPKPGALPKLPCGLSFRLKGGLEVRGLKGGLSPCGAKAGFSPCGVKGRRVA